VQCIGQGGMGVVYNAQELATGRTVALKMMNHRLIYYPRAVQWFKREAAILKTLHHASLAQLYEYFSAYKTQFLAMEFCDGSTLSAVLAGRGALPEGVVRPMLGQLAVALRYVHERGVIHRDLKPSNIMLNDSGSIKVLDFGIGTFDSDSERSGDVVGTPRYMAPEQFSNRDVDRRADFYGLASVAFEALSGGPVVDATDLMGIVLEQAAFVLPPRERIGQGISAELYDILVQGLQHDRENRSLDLDWLAAWAGPVDLGPAGTGPHRTSSG
jgi:serine/threonine-protein kinase